MDINTDSIFEMYGIKPPEGYYLLTKGQEVRKGDLFYSPKQEAWIPTKLVGAKVMQSAAIFMARKI